MRLFCFWVLFTFSTQTLMADPWEDLTLGQARAVVKFLAKNPYILDYCDCCGQGEVYLMRVIKTDIVTCSYNESKKSVVATVQRIGQLETDASGTPSAYRTKALSEAPTTFTITMNYTFVLGKRDKWAVPLFKEVPYDQVHVCKGATRFPNPFDNNDIKDAGYMAWFRKMKLK